MKRLRAMTFAALCLMPSLAQAVTAEAVLPDDKQTANIGGTQVRKGTIAATIANAQKFNELTAELNQLVADVDNLLPGLHAVGLMEFFPVETWLTSENEGKAFVAILYLQKYPELRTEQVNAKLQKLHDEASPWLRQWIR